MLHIPEQRPFTAIEVEEKWLTWAEAVHRRLQMTQQLVESGASPEDLPTGQIPKPEFLVPTMLMTDRYLVDSMQFEHYRNVTTTLVFSMLIFSYIYRVANETYSPRLGYEFVVVLTLVVLLSYPFSKEYDKYTSLMKDLQKPEKR